MAGRLTTEYTRADSLGVGWRYLDSQRTEHTVVKATLLPEAQVVRVETTNDVIFYDAWTLLAVYVIDGRKGN